MGKSFLFLYICFSLPLFSGVSVSRIKVAPEAKTVFVQAKHDAQMQDERKTDRLWEERQWALQDLMFTFREKFGATVPLDEIIGYVITPYEEKYAIIKKIIAEKKKPRDATLNDCLRFAINYNDDILAEILLKYFNVDPNFYSYGGLTPLHIATKKNLLLCMQYLLQAGANVHARSNDQLKLTPLHSAAFYNYSKALQLLIDHGANIYATDKLGETPLHAAVLSRQKDRVCIDLLIQEDEKIRKTNKSLMPLIEMPNNVFLTPLHSAIAADKIKVVEILIARGADLEYVAKNIGSPLHHALFHSIFVPLADKISIAEILIKAGAAINSVNKNGNTLLHELVKEFFNFKSVFHLLFDNGIDLSIKNNDGKTAYELARSCARNEIDKILASKPLAVEEL